jgi:hypothetical protein
MIFRYLPLGACAFAVICLFVPTGNGQGGLHRRCRPRRQACCICRPAPPHPSSGKSVARKGAKELTIERTEEGVTVKVDGQLFTEYVIKSGAKPILWPIIGPTGKPMTRSYPLEEVASEEHDHPHQRSLWFTHGNVNGIDFWSELAGHGTTVHREFVKVAGGPRAVIETRNDWMGPKGDKQCEDVRRLTFHADEDSRAIDFDITIKAVPGAVTFGDTKEGAFAVRVASTIRVESEKGGRIVNSDGLVDKAAWGKAASWVDYQGPIDGKKVGIAILNHPSSFRYPTFWHVRTYGLFAANPFGVHDFTGSAGGSFTLPAGKSIELKYRVLLHKGDEKSGKVAEAFAAYKSEKH